MKIETVKKAAKALLDKEINKFKVINVVEGKKNEQDHESADQIAFYKIKETQAKIVFDKPGYEDFGFEIERVEINKTTKCAEIDESGVNFEANGESVSKTEKHFYNGVFSEKIELMDCFIAHDLNEYAELNDIELQEGNKVELGQFSMFILEEALDNYLKKEHKISFESVAQVLRKAEAISGDEPIERLLRETVENGSTEIYKEIRESQNRSKDIQWGNVFS